MAFEIKVDGFKLSKYFDAKCLLDEIASGEKKRIRSYKLSREIEENCEQSNYDYFLEKFTELYPNSFFNEEDDQSIITIDSGDYRAIILRKMAEQDEKYNQKRLQLVEMLNHADEER